MQLEHNLQMPHLTKLRIKKRSDSSSNTAQVRQLIICAFFKGLKGGRGGGGKVGGPMTCHESCFTQHEVKDKLQQQQQHMHHR